MSKISTIMAKKHKINKLVYGTIFLILAALFSGCNKSLDLFDSTSLSGDEKLRAQAIQIIKTGLTNQDPQIRTKAIEAAAAAKQNTLMPQVAGLLRDDYVPVRFAVALAVGDMQYQLAEDSIKKQLRAPDENTKIAASYAMYKLGHHEYLEYITQAAKSHDQNIRANAVWLLGKTGDKSVSELLYQVKNDDNSELKVRFQAAEALAKFKDEKIFPKLWTMLISKYVDNKIIGIRAMGSLGTAQAKEVLLTKLDDDILEVRLAAAGQLGMLGDISGEPEVLKVFEKDVVIGRDKKDIERINVLTALAIGQIGTEKLIKFLPKLLENESKSVQLAAAQAILQTVKLRNTEGNL